MQQVLPPELHPWTLPQDLVSTLNSSRCCNESCHMHSDPWKHHKYMVTTPTSSRYYNKSCTTTPEVGRGGGTLKKKNLTCNVFTSARRFFNVVWHRKPESERKKKKRKMIFKPPPQGSKFGTFTKNGFRSLITVFKNSSWKTYHSCSIRVYKTLYL